MTLGEIALMTFVVLLVFFGGCIIREIIVRRTRAEYCDCIVPDYEQCLAHPKKGCYYEWRS